MIPERVARLASSWICSGCGTRVADVSDAGLVTPPFRCPNAGGDDNVDHLLVHLLDPSAAEFPKGDEPNPFVRYRTLFHSYQLARAYGMGDEDYVALVRALDHEIAGVEERASRSELSRRGGGGFRVTPFGRSASLSDRIGATAEGGIWIKDETGNVAGSHKARHLMGIMLYLQVLDAVGLAAHDGSLAIASCGNAALAAAVVARAARRPLRVFIPPDAPPAIVDRLKRLDATPVVCRRDPGSHGDPCYLQFQQAVARGAIPFCCQGSANGMTIEGGETLGYEMVAAGPAALDAVVIQVGGGALASAVIQAFTRAIALGACRRLPRFYTVQTRGAFPLKRAYDRVLERCAAMEADLKVCATGAAAPQNGASRRAVLQVCPTKACLHYAATHRREFMWPWEDEPRSVARGILDDETYDWLAVASGMLESGGYPVVVDEAELVEAYTLARSTTAINVDHTGAAGLAGLLRLVRENAIAPHENVAVIFSGVQRD